MPRLANQDYIELHNLLRHHWLNDAQPYSHLEPNEQWDLHAYFQPYRQLSNADLLAHRQQVRREGSSLPQRAGRALKKFKVATYVIASQRVEASQATAASDGNRHIHRVTSVQVRPFVRPEPDAAKIAKLLLEIVENNRKELGL